MDRQAYEAMFELEDRHWWYVGMWYITAAVIGEFYPKRRRLEILDAGCGTGGTTSNLSHFGNVTGCDLSPLAVDLSHQRGLERLAQASVVALPYAGERFDLVTSFDVLYHNQVIDFGQALAEMQRVLKPAGRLFLRLPAYDWLRGHHDQVVHTAHRFTAGEVMQALESSGWRVEKVSYCNTLLFPLALGMRAVQQVLPSQGQGDIRPNPKWQDSLLSRVLRAESRWLGQRTLPFGLTVLAMAQKA